DYYCCSFTSGSTWVF
nr:immunoglobulin light chain junction region [Macaca mulatta]MOX34587.1 immunoglobulin light chain junction region [Macaca mulatta]MOX35227.1 immunoglobulin light chain junction region [Macaca mulatta]MOX36194.1 immunoglobulin light chain junction region [Macaca mulatta]